MLPAFGELCNNGEHSGSATEVAGGPAGDAELLVGGVQPPVLAAAVGDDPGAPGGVLGERPLGRD